MKGTISNNHPYVSISKAFFLIRIITDYSPTMSPKMSIPAATMVTMIEMISVQRKIIMKMTIEMILRLLTTQQQLVMNDDNSNNNDHNEDDDDDNYDGRYDNDNDHVNHKDTDSPFNHIILVEKYAPELRKKLRIILEINPKAPANAQRSWKASRRFIGLEIN